MKLSAYELSTSRDGMLRLCMRDDLPTRRPSTSTDTFPYSNPPVSPPQTPASTADGGRRVGTYHPMDTATHRVVLCESSLGCLRFKVERKPDVLCGTSSRARAVAMGVLTLLVVLGALFA